MKFCKDQAHPQPRLRVMHKNEKSFFENLLNTSSKGWSVAIQDHLQPGNMNLSSLNAYLYAVDTSNAWLCAGAMTGSQFDIAAQSIASAGLTPQSVKDHAGNYIAQLSASQNNQAGVTIEQALSMLAAAMTTTQTFNIVKNAGQDFSGHWVYMIYRAKDLSIVGRPLHFKTQAPGLVDHDQLLGVVKSVVHNDLYATQMTNVGREVTLGGGPILAPMFEEQSTRSMPRPGSRSGG